MTFEFSAYSYRLVFFLSEYYSAENVEMIGQNERDKGFFFMKRYIG